LAKAAELSRKITIDVDVVPEPSSSTLQKTGEPKLKTDATRKAPEPKLKTDSPLKTRGPKLKTDFPLKTGGPTVKTDSALLQLLMSQSQNVNRDAPRTSLKSDSPTLKTDAVPAPEGDSSTSKTLETDSATLKTDAPRSLKTDTPRLEIHAPKSPELKTDAQKPLKADSPKVKADAPKLKINSKTTSPRLKAASKIDSPKLKTASPKVKQGGQKPKIDSATKAVPTECRAIQIDQRNPKKPGSMSWSRYEDYKAATTTDEFLELGGTRADLVFDSTRGYVTFVDDENDPIKRDQAIVFEGANPVTQGTPEFSR